MRSQVRGATPAARGGRKGRSGRQGALRFPPLAPWLRENLARSLPVLVVGGLGVVIAVWLDASHVHLLSSRLPFGLLLGAVGGTLLGGGVALTIVEEPTPAFAPVPEGYVVVERAAWERLRADLEPPWQEGVEPTPEVLYPVPGPDAGIGPTTSPVGRSHARVASEEARGTTPRRPPSAPATPAAPPVTPSGPPPTLAVGLAEAAAPASAAPPVPPPRPPAGAPFPASPPPRPSSHEELIREFEAVLSRLDRAPLPTPRTATPQRPSRTTDRCLACGALVTAYLEQVCVVCDRPLCDRCLDATIVAGHPSVCEGCQGSVRA